MFELTKLFVFITLMIAVVQVAKADEQLYDEVSAQDGDPESDHGSEDDLEADHQSNQRGSNTPVLPGKAQAGASSFPFERELRDWLVETFAKESEIGRVKDMLDGQVSNDFNANLSTKNLLIKLGLPYKIHHVTSEDGYKTQLIRVKDPRAGGAEPAGPPVVLYAGQGYSPAIFLATSTLERSSQGYGENDIYLGNHSLVLNLLYNGFDVWLVPARGVDQENRAIDEKVHMEYHQSSGATSQSQARGLADLSNLGMSPLGQTQRPVETNPIQIILDGFKKLVHSFHHVDYWSFSNDEIASSEFKRQLELISRQTGGRKLSLIDYSYGAFVSYIFMATEPEFVSQHIGAHISIAPAVFVNGFNMALGGANLLSHLNIPGTPYPPDVVNFIIRGTLTELCRSKTVRYTICKTILNGIYGPSEMFNTFIELVLLDYVGKPISPKALHQMSDAASSGKLRHYDHQLVGNLLRYKQVEPPEYDLSKAKCQHRLIITGDRDTIVDPDSVRKLQSKLEGQDKRIEVPGYNHLDMLAGSTVVTKVHWPILEFLFGLHHNTHQSGARNVNSLPKGIEKSSRGGSKPEPTRQTANTSRQVQKAPTSVIRTGLTTLKPSRFSTKGMSAVTRPTQKWPLRIKQLPTTIVPRK